jgi:capsular polysaccharide biosynthesis protein
VEQGRKGKRGLQAMVVAVVVAVVLVAVGVAGASLLQTPTYEASALILVDERAPEHGTGNGKIQPIPNAPTPETLRALTQTMVHAIDSRPVAEEVIQRLGLQMKPAELLDNLTIEQDAGTSFIRLTYEDTDPERARLIVNTVSEVSSERISPISAVASKFTATGCPLKCSVYSSRHLPSPRGLWSR